MTASLRFPLAAVLLLAAIAARAGTGLVYVANEKDEDRKSVV